MLITIPSLSGRAEQRVGLMVPSSNTGIETEFIDAMNAPIVRFLEANGFEVLGARGLGCSDNLAIGRLPSASADRLARELDCPASEAFVFLCTNWRVLTAVERIERKFGKPVVTSNQASLRAALLALGRRRHVDECGRLLAA